MRQPTTHVDCRRASALVHLHSMRSFGAKYKDSQFAEYYAGKHESTLGRRMSNRFEKSMVRRALGFVRRIHPMQDVLDCPSGTGRFLPLLAEFDASVIAVDTSQAMLHEGRRHDHLFTTPPQSIVASAADLPVSDGSVDVALCCRLLHHFEEADARIAILRELARVARWGVVVSFFDSTCYRSWRRRRKTARKGAPTGRHAITRAQCEHEAQQAGLSLLGMTALLRYHTEVTAAAFRVPKA